jgi:pantetheine-phosphate adenylyltransferase
MIQDVVRDIPNVRVEHFSGLSVDFAHRCHAAFIVRGLRAVTDFEYELQMAQTNRSIDRDIDTIFFTTALNYAYISSSTVKEVAWYGGDISGFVPPEIAGKVYGKIRLLQKQL